MRFLFVLYCFYLFIRIILCLNDVRKELFALFRGRDFIWSKLVILTRTFLFLCTKGQIFLKSVDSLSSGLLEHTVIKAKKWGGGSLNTKKY